MHVRTHSDRHLEDQQRKANLLVYTSHREGESPASDAQDMMTCCLLASGEDQHPWRIPLLILHSVNNRGVCAEREP